jgi:hypothetical protein
VGGMRIIGRRTLPDIGLRGPTEDEVRASQEIAQRSFIRAPKGVYRYRNHAEANADMDRWIADTMAERARELCARSATPPTASKSS